MFSRTLLCTSNVHEDGGHIRSYRQTHLAETTASFSWARVSVFQGFSLCSCRAVLTFPCACKDWWCCGRSLHLTEYHWCQFITSPEHGRCMPFSGTEDGQSRSHSRSQWVMIEVILLLSQVPLLSHHIILGGFGSACLEWTRFPQHSLSVPAEQSLWHRFHGDVGTVADVHLHSCH